MNAKSLVSIGDYSRDDILSLLASAADFERNPNRMTLAGKVVATLFFEPSTRTRLSFEAAACRLGARVIGFSDAATSSSAKGESLHDTVQIVAGYADVIIIRHYLEGAARYAAEVSSVPVINAGDGSNQHPTQTLLDLYAILQTQRRLEGLNICLAGDLKYGRTVHSLIQALSHFQPTFTFVSARELALPDEYKSFCRRHDIPYKELTELADALHDADILYMTRVQRERFADPMEYERVKHSCTLTRAMLAATKDNLRVLHPLPRVGEIAEEVDNDPKAYYFQQARGGLFVRQAIISRTLEA